MLSRLALLAALCLACTLAQTFPCNTWKNIPTSTPPPGNGLGSWFYSPETSDYWKVQRIVVVAKSTDLAPYQGLTVQFRPETNADGLSYPCTCDQISGFSCGSALSQGSGSFSFGGRALFDPVPPFTTDARAFAVGTGIPSTGFLIPNNPASSRRYQLTVNCDANMPNPRTGCPSCSLGNNDGGEWEMRVLSLACCGTSPTYYLGDGPANVNGCTDHLDLPGCAGGSPFSISQAGLTATNIEFFVPDTFPTAPTGDVLTINITDVTHECLEAIQIVLQTPQGQSIPVQAAATSGSCTAANGNDVLLTVSNAQWLAGSATAGQASSGSYQLQLFDMGYRVANATANVGSYLYYSITFNQAVCTPPTPSNTPTPPPPSATPSNSRTPSLVSKSVIKTPKLTTTPSNAPVSPSASPASRYGACAPLQAAARIYFTRCDVALQAAQVQAVTAQLATDLSVDGSRILVCGRGNEIVGCADSQANSGQITEGGPYMYIEVQVDPQGEKGFKPEGGIIKVVNDPERSAVYNQNFVASSGNEPVVPNEDAIGDPDANLYKPYESSSSKDDTGLIVGLTIGLTCFCLLVIVAVVLLALVLVGPVVLGKKE